MQRHGRQEKLPEVGAAGQARIEQADVAVPLEGFAAEVAARYLAGAGVARVRVRHAAIALAAGAVDPRVAVVVDHGLHGLPSEVDSDAALLTELRDPIARDLALGALTALRLLRGVLEGVDGRSGD